MACIVVDTGPMFGGKSLKLIERILNAEYKGQEVLAIRPMTDRHPEPFIIARRVVKGVVEDTLKYPARIITTRREFKEVCSNPSLSFVAIDEGQFFRPWIVPEVALAIHLRRWEEDFTIAIAGLNMDYARRPFDPMPHLMAMASKLRVHAGVCMKCKGRYGLGLYTQRIRGGVSVIQPGNFGDYEVRCGVCHFAFTE